MTSRPTAVLSLTAVVVLAAAVLAGCGPHSSGPAPAAVERGTGQASVVRVVDGDTIKVRIDGRDERVRLIGIDTPETKKPDSPVECFGHEASARLQQLLPRQTPVRLVRDADARDRYGRLLAYVYRSSDDLFVNLAMARDGFAAALTIPPNVAHTEEFVSAAASARRANRGLWGRCASGHSPLGSSP